MAISSSAVPSQSPGLSPSNLATEFDYPRRRARLMASLEGKGGAAKVALICDQVDIMYLTGVREGVSWLAVWNGGGFVVTRHMLVREVAEHVGGLELLLPCERSTDPVDLEGFVVTELANRGFETVSTSLDSMTAASYLRLARRNSEAGMELEAVSHLVESLRQSKDELEHELISRCISIAEEAFAGLLEKGARGLFGRTEIDLARELESRMLSLGADRQGFPGTGIIVASGPNSASAHHRPGQRRVEPGEPLLVDWGAELDGYRSDMTRTLFPGSIPDFARKAYPVVQSALASAADALRVGASMGEVDQAAREIVMRAEFPEFHYGVGHGIGLAIHEAPWLRAHSKDRLEEGMITTVEPGIYLPGVGGIRIESIYSLNATGAERMDSLPTSLEEMVLE